MNDDYYETEFMEGYNDLEEFRDELIGYLLDRVYVPDFNSDYEEFTDDVNNLIDQLLKL